MVKRWIRVAFGFSRKETNGFLILLPLLAVVLFSAPVYRWWASRQEHDFSQEQAFLDSLASNWQPEPQTQDSGAAEIQSFRFDPNEIPQGDFLRLGFPEFLTRRIINYREKGGRFKVKSDLLKIYGIDSALYKRLYSYLELPVELAASNENKEAEDKPPVAKKPLQRFDLNHADTLQLMSVYGIGKVLSGRIVKFREVLGGFININQLYEVYGLDSAVVKKLGERAFIDENFQSRKINLNTASEEELSIHPYISKPVAKALVAYRFQHGNFTQVEDIRKVYPINDENYRMIIPYLTIDK